MLPIECPRGRGDSSGEWLSSIRYRQDTTEGTKSIFGATPQELSVGTTMGGAQDLMKNLGESLEGGLDYDDEYIYATCSVAGR